MRRTLSSLVLSLGLSLGLLFALPAFADFSGKWEGKGDFSMSNGNKGACERIAWTLEQSPTALKIVSGSFNCGGEPGQWPSTTLQIQNGGELWLDGRKLGTITANEMNIRIEDDGSLMTVKLVISSSTCEAGSACGAPTMHFEQYSNSDGETVQLHGELTKQQ